MLCLTKAPGSVVNETGPYVARLRATLMEAMGSLARFDETIGKCKASGLVCSRPASVVKEAVEGREGICPRPTDFGLYVRHAFHLEANAREGLDCSPEIDMDTGMENGVRLQNQVGRVSRMPSS